MDENGVTEFFDKTGEQVKKGSLVVVASGQAAIDKVNAKVDENPTMKYHKDESKKNIKKATDYVSSAWGSVFGGWGSKTQEKAQEMGSDSTDQNQNDF